MKKIMKVLAVLSAVSLLLLAFASTAQAKTIVSQWEEEIDEETYYPADYYMNPCDFPMVLHMHGIIRYQEFLNSDGYYGYRAYDGQLKVDYYHPDTPEKMLHARMQGTFTSQELNQEGTVWTEKLTGPNWLITVPGYGPVNGFAGVLMVQVTVSVDENGEEIWDIVYLKDAGLRVDRTAEGFQAFCDYLRP